METTVGRSAQRTRPRAVGSTGGGRAARHPRRGGTPETLSLFDQLNLWFPRLAWAAVVIMVLSVAADWGLTAAGVPGLGDGVTQISAQWLLTPTGL